MNYYTETKEKIMTTIANYFMVRDSFFTLREDEDMRFPETGGFSLPPGTALGRNDRAILAFVADPSSGAEDLAYEVQVNGVDITSGQFTGGVKRGLWEPFPANILLAGDDTNSVQFRVLSGDGRVRIGKVVLWFQQEI
jgi:hypothetical protein